MYVTLSSIGMFNVNITLLCLEFSVVVVVIALLMACCVYTSHDGSFYSLQSATVSCILRAVRIKEKSHYVITLEKSLMAILGKLELGTLEEGQI